jgi:hypothetical protein
MTIASNHFPKSELSRPSFLEVGKTHAQGVEWDFAQHAKDCQKLAAKTKTRTRKIELLSLAAVWELLAQVRAEQLGRYEPRRDRAEEAA